MGERIEREIGFFNRVAGHTYDTVYDLLFTTERVIALIVQHPLDMPVNLSVVGIFLGGRLGVRDERSARIKLAEERRRFYEENGIDELANYHRFNFQIPYNEITSIELIRGLLKARVKFHISGPTRGERKIQFTFPKRRVPEVLDLLEKTIPSRLIKK